MENLNLNPQMQNPNTSPAADSNQQSQPMMPAKNKNILFMVAIIVLVVAGGLLWWYVGQADFSYGPQTQIVMPADRGAKEESRISKDIMGVDVGNLDTQFQGVDSDLNGL